MKRFFSRLLTAAALVSVLAASAQPSPGAAQNTLRAAALVNDEVISIFDLVMRTRLAILASGLSDTPEVRNRQIIVARLEDEVTVKRYRQEGKTVWLLPENDEFTPIEIDLNEQHLVIEGVVVGLLRNGIPLRH